MSFLHLHVHCEDRDLVLLCHRHLESPNRIIIDRIIVDGIELGELSQYIETFHTTIESEFARKLAINRNKLTIIEQNHDLII